MPISTSEALNHEYNIIVTQNAVTILAYYDWEFSLEVIEDVLTTASFVISTNDQSVALRIQAVTGILEVATGMSLIHNLGALGLIQAYAQNEKCGLQIIE